MQKILDHMGVHFTSLQLRSQRNEILASNIANASTPNYKARDINFGLEIMQSISLTTIGYLLFESLT